MRRVIIESPFTAPTPEGIEKHRNYLRECGLDCLRRGEAPFASHGLYPQWLNDADRNERAWGITAGFAWRAVAAATVVYCDLGVSPGMLLGIAAANAQKHPIEYRALVATDLGLQSVYTTREVYRDEPARVAVLELVGHPGRLHLLAQPPRG